MAKKKKITGGAGARRVVVSQAGASASASSSSAASNSNSNDERKRKNEIGNAEKSIEKMTISGSTASATTATDAAGAGAKDPFAKFDAAALDMCEKAMELDPSDPQVSKMLRGALKLVTSKSGNAYLTISSTLFGYAVRNCLPELADQYEMLMEERGGGSTGFVRDVMASLKAIEDDKINNTAKKMAHERAVFYSTILQDHEKAKAAFEEAIKQLDEENETINNSNGNSNDNNAEVSESGLGSSAASASSTTVEEEEANAMTKEFKKDEMISLRYHYANFCDRIGDQEKAESLFRSVVSLNPNHVLAINNLATILIEKKTDDSYDEAETLLKKAQEISPGFPAYNLACIASLRRLHADCENYLHEALSTNGIPSSQDLLEDNDFENVRKESWFQRIVDHMSSLEKETEREDNEDQDEPRMLVINPALVDYYNFSVKGKTKIHNVRIYMGSGGGKGATTGSSLWNAAMVTMRYLETRNCSESEKNMLEGKRVLDLSAGTGLIGIVCAKLGARVTMTDIGEAQIELMARNVEANGMVVAVDGDPIPYKSVQVVPLGWKKHSEIEAELSTSASSSSSENEGEAKKYNIQSEFDIIVASDLLYIAIRETLQDELVETIERYCKNTANEGESNPKEAIVCFEERSLLKEKELVEYLSATLESKNGLHENELDEEDLCLDDVKIANKNSDGEELGLQDMFASADQEVTIRLIQYISKE